MNLPISAPSINLSISTLFRILHILSILTGPNIFLSICLSKMRRLFHKCDNHVLQISHSQHPKSWQYYTFEN
jgi:hypothetical protein